MKNKHKSLSHEKGLYKTKKSLLLFIAVTALLLINNIKISAQVYSTAPGCNANLTQYSDYGSYSGGRNYYYFNGWPQYGLYYNYNNNGNNRWEIWQVAPNVQMEYYSSGNGTLPPRTGWNSYYGAAPVPVLSGPSTMANCETPGVPVSLMANWAGPTTANIYWGAGYPAGAATVYYYWVVGTSSGVTYGSGTAQSYTTGTSAGVPGLAYNTTYYLRVYAYTTCNGTSSGYSTSSAFTTYPANPTSVSATATTVCSGTGTTLTANGAQGTVYWSTDCANYQVTGNTWTVYPTSTTTYYARNYNGNFSSGCASITIYVNPLPTALSLTGSSQCGSGSIGTITSTTSVSGINYQLYNSGNSTVGSAKAGTNAALSWTSLAGGTGYYVKGTNASTSCVSANSNGVTVAVNSPPSALSISGSTICTSPGGNGTITSTTSVSGINYQLYNSSNATVQTAKAGTGSALAWTGLSAGTGYYVKGTNATTSCVSSNSNTADVSTTANPSVPTGTASQSFCNSGTVAGLQATGSNIQWYAASSGGTALITSTALANATHYYATQSSGGCESTTRFDVTVTLNSLPTSYSVTGGGGYCPDGSGMPVGLSGSQTGVNYQLKRNGTATGSPVAGTASAITFGNQTTYATYTVVATNTTTSCSATMTGSVDVIVLNAAVASEPELGPGASPICAGATSSLSTGGIIGNTVQWQNSTDNISFGNITGATGGSYTTPALYATTYYRYIVTNGTCTANSPSTTIVVNTTAAPTGTASQVLCAGATVADLTATGTTIQWYAASSGGTALSGSTALANNTHYYAGQTLNSCESSTRLDVTVTLNSLPTAYSVTGGGSYCAGGSGMPVGLSGSQTGVNYQLKRNGSSQGSPVAGTGSAITFGNQTTYATYTVVATNATTSCTATMTGSVDVIVWELPMASDPMTGPGGNPICSGSAAIIYPGGYTGTGFQWQSSSDNSIFANITGATGSNYTTPALTNSTYYRYVLSNAHCSVNSPSLQIEIKATPTPSIAGTLTICSGSSNTLSTSSYSSYLWSTGAATQSISVSTAGSYNVTVTASNGCSAAATPVTTVVSSLLTPSISGSLVMCSGSSTTLDAGLYSGY
ncbi:MAG: hypothetical protein WCL06_09300, partial [Bacteroidota bacterium]